MSVLQGLLTVRITYEKTFFSFQMLYSLNFLEKCSWWPLALWAAWLFRTSQLCQPSSNWHVCAIVRAKNNFGYFKFVLIPQYDRFTWSVHNFLMCSTSSEVQTLSGPIYHFVRKNTHYYCFLDKWPLIDSVWPSQIRTHKNFMRAKLDLLALWPQCL